MSSIGAEALAALHVLVAAIRVLSDKAVLSDEDVGQIFDIAVEECARAGSMLVRNKEAVALMTQIRESDFAL